MVARLTTPDVTTIGAVPVTLEPAPAVADVTRPVASTVMDDGEAYVPAAADAARLIALPVTTTGDVPVYKNSFCTFRVIVKVKSDKYLKIAIAGLFGSIVPVSDNTKPVHRTMISLDD